MRKTFILDTSVLVQDPYVFEKFTNGDVIIPAAVLNELDDLKKNSNDAGKNARIAIRLLDEITADEDLSKGIDLEGDIRLFIDTQYFNTKDLNLKSFGNQDYGDTQILVCAYLFKLSNPDIDVTLVTNDINLKIKARARGINAESHLDKKSSLNDLYSGVQVIKDVDAGIELQQNGSLDPRLFQIVANPHECVLFEDDDGNAIALGRKVNFDKIKLIKKSYPWKIAAKNKEQAFAIDLIMDRGVDLVTMVGKAGSGKSLVALATALELVLNKKEYDKLIIYRPIQSVGNDIGYLPGTMEEKLAPWFQAIMDNFEFLFSNKENHSNNDWKKDLEMYQRKGRIEMDAITYIRGRSIPNSIMLIDEAQNLTKDEIKTILTRAGEGTKIILNGDIDQIDNSDLDALNNGLTYVIEKFKTSELAGHVTFVQGERSRLASKAAEIL